MKGFSCGDTYSMKWSIIYDYFYFGLSMNKHLLIVSSRQECDDYFLNDNFNSKKDWRYIR